MSMKARSVTSSTRLSDKKRRENFPKDLPDWLNPKQIMFAECHNKKGASICRITAGAMQSDCEHCCWKQFAGPFWGNPKNVKKCYDTCPVKGPVSSC